MGVQYIPECSITIFLNVYQVAGIKKNLGHVIIWLWTSNV